MENKIAREDIHSWLLATISQELDMDPATIDQDKDIAEYGLDSLASTTIVAEIETKLEMELPATLLWDYPTIREIVDFLKGHISKEQ